MFKNFRMKVGFENGALDRGRIVRPVRFEGAFHVISRPNSLFHDGLAFVPASPVLSVRQDYSRAVVELEWGWEQPTRGQSPRRPIPAHADPNAPNQYTTKPTHTNTDIYLYIYICIHIRTRIYVVIGVRVFLKVLRIRTSRQIAPSEVRHIFFRVVARSTAIDKGGLFLWMELMMISMLIVCFFYVMVMYLYVIVRPWLNKVSGVDYLALIGSIILLRCNETGLKHADWYKWNIMWCIF